MFNVNGPLNATELTELVLRAAPFVVIAIEFPVTFSPFVNVGVLLNVTDDDDPALKIELLFKDKVPALIIAPLLNVQLWFELIVNARTGAVDPEGVVLKLI